jgi:hypothetical protein
MKDMEGANPGKVRRRGFLGNLLSALATLRLPLPSLSKNRNDGPENFLVLIRHLDEREAHIRKRTRILPSIEIGPHHLAFDDDLFPVGKFDDHLVDLALRELLIAVDEYSAGSDIS